MERVPFKDEPAASHCLLGIHEVGQGQAAKIHMTPHDRGEFRSQGQPVLGCKRPARMGQHSDVHVTVQTQAAFGRRTEKVSGRHEGPAAQMRRNG